MVTRRRVAAGLLAVVVLMTGAPTASADILIEFQSVTPDFVVPGAWRWTYTHTITAGDGLENSFFTLYDVPGIATVSPSGGFQASSTFIGDTPSGQSPIDSPNHRNVTFKSKVAEAGTGVPVEFHVISHYNKPVLGRYAWLDQSAHPVGFPQSGVGTVILPKNTSKPGITVTLESVAFDPLALGGSFRWRYSAAFGDGLSLDGAYFTIYDVPGLLSVEAPFPNWHGNAQLLGDTPSGVNPPDDPALKNVTIKSDATGDAPFDPVYFDILTEFGDPQARPRYAWFGSTGVSRAAQSGTAQVGAPIPEPVTGAMALVGVIAIAFRGGDAAHAGSTDTCLITAFVTFARGQTSIGAASAT